MTNPGLVINGENTRNKNADKYMIIHKLVWVFLNIWYFNAVMCNKIKFNLLISKKRLVIEL